MDDALLLAKLNTLKILQDIDFDSLESDDKIEFESYHKGYITAIDTVISIIEEQQNK